MMLLWVFKRRWELRKMLKKEGEKIKERRGKVNVKQSQMVIL